MRFCNPAIVIWLLLLALVSVTTAQTVKTPAERAKEIAGWRTRPVNPSSVS